MAVGTTSVAPSIPMSASVLAPRARLLGAAEAAAGSSAAAARRAEMLRTALPVIASTPARPPSKVPRVPPSQRASVAAACARAFWITAGSSVSNCNASFFHSSVSARTFGSSAITDAKVLRPASPPVEAPSSAAPVACAARWPTTPAVRIAFAASAPPAAICPAKAPERRAAPRASRPVPPPTAMLGTTLPANSMTLPAE